MWLALRGVHVHAVLRGLRTISYPEAGAAAIALAAGVAVRIVRWWLLFTPGRRPRVVAVSRALLIGYLFNSVLPFRAGEVARAVALHRETGTSRTESLTTTVTERLFDVLMLAALAGVAALFLPTVPWLGNVLLLGAASAAVIAVAAVAVVLFDRRFSASADGHVRLGRLGSQVSGIVCSAVDGLRVLRSAPAAAAVVLATAASWLLLALSSWLLLLACGVDGSFAVGLLVVVAANLALVIPSSPGGLGVFEAAVVAALAAERVGATPAFGYAVVLHALNLFPYIVAGAIALRGHATATGVGGVVRLRGRFRAASPQVAVVPVRES
jgi:uncharacterized protein (TIRG00374 family)